MTSEENRKEETSVINACILRSKEICLLIAARVRNRNTQFLVNRSLRTLRSQGSCKDIEDELNQHIDDHKLSIARLLKPLFAKHEIPFRDQIAGMDVFWFSLSDLQSGYILLTNHKNISIDQATDVLFLNDLNNPFVQIKAGEIKPYREVASFLNEVEAVWDGKILAKVIIKPNQDEQ